MFISFAQRRRIRTWGFQQLEGQGKSLQILKLDQDHLCADLHQIKKLGDLIVEEPYTPI